MTSPQQTFIEQMGLVAEADGLPRIGGSLFALLVVSDEPRSLDELAEALGVSKASVSTEARRLVDRGIAQRVPRPAGRRDYYAIAPDFLRRLIEHRLARWSRFRALVDDCRAQLGASSPTVARRLDEVVDVQQRVVRAAKDALDAKGAGATDAERTAPRTGTRDPDRTAPRDGSRDPDRTAPRDGSRDPAASARKPALARHRPAR